VAPAQGEPAWVKLASAIAVALGIIFFCAPIAKSGIWDPFELNVADLSRRIAINRLGAHGLSLDGADNTMPRLSDLGRGELPFDSIALGFRIFGLHEWSGRLPLALWGIAGVASLYWLLSRLIDRRAGLYGAVVLCTMPLYFMQARTMLGDVVIMGAISMAFAGLGLATFDRPKSGIERKLALVVGAAGLVAGFMTRGALIGVAVPALSVGLCWMAMWATSPRKAELFGEISGAASLVVGAVATCLGVVALSKASTTEYSMMLGAQVSTQSKFPTFDLVIHYLGHSLFPWSAFIPFAVGRLFRIPPAPAQGDGTASSSGTADDADLRASAMRLLALVGSAVAFAAYSTVAAKAGYLAFGAPALLAAIAAISIHDFELGAPASRALGVGVAVLCALYLRDYDMFPEKGLSAFAVNPANFPDSFKDRANNLILLSCGIFSLIVFFSWLEEQVKPHFEIKDYLGWPRSLVRAWGGNLVLVLVALEVGLVIAAATLWSALHIVHAKQASQIGLTARIALLNAFWIVPPALLLIVWGTMSLRDCFRFFFDKTGVSRGMATVGAGLIVGGLLSFVYYPALAAQLSPKEVFETYRHYRKAGEPLGLLGVGGKSASYYEGGDVKLLSDVQSAFNWLTSGSDRKWLAVRNEDLPRLNSLFRARPGPKQNLPVLDARSSQILLVSNLLLPGEHNEGPYESMVLDHEPQIGNRVEVNLQDQLLSLGWDVTNDSGARIESVFPGKKYHFRLYYKVLAPVPGEWETFIHIDGFNRRFNGDHKTLAGKYSFSLWQAGDYIVDDYEFSLEPNFTRGDYNVYYGLFVGETRLKVKTGPHQDNRIDGGKIHVVN
jgi:4-amino-4-deoxy-L-arabinose transferase-like glycosyltransferase